MKSSIKTLMVGGALLGLAGTANATDINIYGASAQYNFWKQAGREFLLNSVGCPAATTSAFTSFDSKNGIIYATGCPTTVVPDGQVKFRVSNKASFDGIFAVTSSTDTQATPGGCAANARPMADMALPTDTAATSSCQVVTIGASDVPAKAFVQHSSGQLKGPLNGGATGRNFGASGISVSSGIAAVYEPVKVPFGMFVTSNIQVQTCTAGPTIGDYCNTAEDCGIGGTCGAARPITINDNITREMATQIFSNTLPNHNWSDFAGFSSLPAEACVRHAGSGSHATMDLGLMNKAWGKFFPNIAVVDQFWYNDSTGNLLDCMNEVQKAAGSKTAGSAAIVQGGALGYADADVDATNGATIPVGTIIGPLKYNGSFPNSQNIKSGVYDLFADQTLYVANTANADQTSLISSLMTYLNDATGSHLNTAGYNFKNFWAASAEMKVGRGSTAATLNPFAYPARGGQNPNPGQ